MAIGIVGLAAIVVLIWWIPDVAPDGDVALIDLSVLETLGPGRYVGAYSRFGWQHPGPMFFQLLAPLYWLGGERHLAVLITSAAINVASIGTLVAILFRRNPCLACGVFGLLAFYAIRMNGLLASSWNPHVAVLPFACLVIAAADTAAGATSLLPLVLALATFVVQTHVSYAPLSALAVLVASTAVRLRSARRPFLIALALGFALWAYPLVDQFSSRGSHNLSHIVEFARTHSAGNPPAASLIFWRMTATPIASAASLWNAAPAPTVERQPGLLSVWQLSGLIVAGATWLILRRPFEAILALIVLVMITTGYWVARRTPDTMPEPHTMLWASILGTLAWGVIAGLFLEMVRFRRCLPAASRWVTIAATLALGAWHVVVVRAAELGHSGRSFALSRVVAGYLEERHAEDVLVHVPQEYWGVATGTVLQLYRAGISTRVDAEWVSMFGPALTPSGTERATIQFATNDERVANFDHRTTHQLLGGSDGYFVFAVAPNPPSSSAPAENAVAGPGGVADGARLADGIASAGGLGPRSPAAVNFVGAAATAIVAPPKTAIGIRLFGEPASVWQLQCWTGDVVRPAGQVRIDDRPDMANGSVFVRGMGTCERLQVGPTTPGRLAWLTEIEILTMPSGRS